MRPSFWMIILITTSILHSRGPCSSSSGESERRKWDDIHFDLLLNWGEFDLEDLSQSKSRVLDESLL
jgi:hypothetical protein